MALRRPAWRPRRRLRLGGRLGRIATLTRPQFGTAGQRIEFLKGDGELRSLQDGRALHRVTQRRDPVLHPVWLNNSVGSRRVTIVIAQDPAQPLATSQLPMVAPKV